MKPSHTLTLVVGYCELWASWWGEGGQGGEGQAAENITSIITMNWDESFLCHRLEQSQGLVSWGISEFQIDKIWWCVNPRVDVSALNDLYFLHSLTDKSFLRWNTCLSNGGYILRRLSKVVHRHRHRLTPCIFNICSLHWRGGPSLPCLRTEFAFPLRTHRPAKEASLEAICDCDVDGWSSEVTIWTHLYNSPLTGGHHWWWPLPCVCVLSSYLYRLVDMAFLFYVSCSVRRWWVPPGHGASSGVSQSGSHLSAHMYPPPIKKYKVRGIKIEILKWWIYIFSYSIIVTNMRTVVVKKISSLSMCRYLWNWKHLLYQMIM